jgi:hypothetical protein
MMMQARDVGSILVQDLSWSPPMDSEHVDDFEYFCLKGLPRAS